MHDYSNLRRILLEVVLIVALGVVVGLSANLKLVHQILTGKIAPAEPATSSSETAAPAYPQPIDLASVQQLSQSQQALLVDARIAEMYADGHLPKARSLPIDETGTMMARFKAEVPLDTLLVLYCNGYGCPDSFDLALLLIAEGYTDVRVFEGGVPEWQDAGLPLVGEDQP